MRLSNGQKIGITTVIMGLVAFFLFTEYKKSQIQKSTDYSVALVFRYFRGTTTGPMLEYKYKVGDELLLGAKYIDTENYKKYKNRFYRVKYASENPGWSEILLNWPVTDTVAILNAGFTLPRKKSNQFQEK